MAGDAGQKVALPELRHGTFLVSGNLSSMWRGRRELSGRYIEVLCKAIRIGLEDES